MSKDIEVAITQRVVISTTAIMDLELPDAVSAQIDLKRLREFIDQAIALGATEEARLQVRCPVKAAAKLANLTVEFDVEASVVEDPAVHWQSTIDVLRQTISQLRGQRDDAMEANAKLRSENARLRSGRAVDHFTETLTEKL